MSSFSRLQNLGKDRFTKITSDLIRGTPAMSMARVIQTEWMEFQDVAEKTLTQQLNRLRIALEKKAFGNTLTTDLEFSSKKKRVEILQGIGDLNVLHEIEELAFIQKKRIIRLSNREEAMPMPLSTLSEIIRDQQKLLEGIQKVRFDLGLDEYKGVLTGVRAGSASITLPDGTNIHRQVYEAVDAVENIFAKRGINGVA